MAIVSDPLYPIAGETVTLSITGLTGDADATQFEIGSVPSLSELDTGMIVDEAGDPAMSFVPDTDGSYNIRAYDYRRYSGIADSDPRDVLVGTQDGEVRVASVATLPIHTEIGHGLTLRLRIVNDTVRVAELIDPLTEVSRVCALASGVTAALAALVGSTVAALTVDLETDVNAIATAYKAHAANVVAHYSADSVNVLRHDPAYSRASAVDTILAIADVLYKHLRGRTDNTGAWHRDADDTANYPIAKRGRSMGEATVLKADIRERVYERHRVRLGSPSVHAAADNTNTLSAPSLLDTLIVAVLDEFVNASPTAPAGEQEGAVDIARSIGFTVTR